MTTLLEPVSVPAEKTESYACLEKARAAYMREEVIGSPEKDVIADLSFKVIGAEVDSSERTRSVLGTTVGAPRPRRFSMAALTLRLASLPCISRTLASRVTGNWISIVMFRRCLTSSFAKIFECGVKGEGVSEEVVGLTRPVAQELMMAFGRCLRHLMPL